ASMSPSPLLPSVGIDRQPLVQERVCLRGRGGGGRGCRRPVGIDRQPLLSPDRRQNERYRCENDGKEGTIEEHGSPSPVEQAPRRAEIARGACLKEKRCARACRQSMPSEAPVWRPGLSGRRGPLVEDHHEAPLSVERLLTELA